MKNKKKNRSRRPGAFFLVCALLCFWNPPHTAVNLPAQHRLYPTVKRTPTMKPNRRDKADFEGGGTCNCCLGMRKKKREKTGGRALRRDVKKNGGRQENNKQSRKISKQRPWPDSAALGCPTLSLVAARRRRQVRRRSVSDCRRGFLCFRCFGV